MNELRQLLGLPRINWRYYWQRLCNAVGYCHRCGTRGNRTSTGRILCPQCGK